MHPDLNYGLWGNDKPIVVFYGETGSGKTTALVRLINYLHNELRYQYSLCSTFHDHYYGSGTPFSIPDSEFKKQLNCSIDKAEGTATACLCNIMDNRGTKCRFLELPGEDVFSVKTEPEKADILVAHHGMEVFKKQYLNDILRIQDYKKVWVFFMDIDMLETHKAFANLYINHITDIANNLNEDDRMIFVINKEDIVRIKYAPVLAKGFEFYINRLFGGFLDQPPFTTESHFLGLTSRRKHFRVIPFSSYTVEYRGLDMEGNPQPPVVVPSSGAYPALLWQTIDDAIMNRFD
jgi:hypothetical protein